MAIAIDLLINNYILNILGNMLNIYLDILDKLYSIYLLFYEQEYIILGNKFPQFTWSPTFAIKSILKTALRIAPN